MTAPSKKLIEVSLPPHGGNAALGGELVNSHDQELLNLLKTIATEYGYSPEALLGMTTDAAKWSKKALIPNFGPYPKTIDEAEITSDVLAFWPEWVTELVPPGSKWERLHWPDGSVTIRLVNHRALVLAAQHLSPDDSVLP